MRVTTILAAVVLNATVWCIASAGTGQPGAATDLLTGFTGTEGHVRVVSVARGVGDQDRVIVTVAIDPGYHINANPPSDKNLIATTLTFDGFDSMRIFYPKPYRFKPKLSNEALDVYQGVDMIVVVFPTGSLSSGTRLHGTLLAQACTDDICLPPAEISFSEQK